MSLLPLPVPGSNFEVERARNTGHGPLALALVLALGRNWRPATAPSPPHYLPTSLHYQNQPLSGGRNRLGLPAGARGSRAGNRLVNSEVARYLRLKGGVRHFHLRSATHLYVQTSEAGEQQTAAGRRPTSANGPCSRFITSITSLAGMRRGTGDGASLQDQTETVQSIPQTKTPNTVERSPERLCYARSVHPAEIAETATVTSAFVHRSAVVTCRPRLQSPRHPPHQASEISKAPQRGFRLKCRNLDTAWHAAHHSSPTHLWRRQEFTDTSIVWGILARNAETDLRLRVHYAGKPVDAAALPRLRELFVDQSNR
ncbi:hypothetical protein CSOJ01_00555 [Colletotrichum sojae]|uniref:Uncharacterized protein n=1 Tax=Colletotrichum sojae TaxID=2175907 RepID=A0A8H6N5Z5_9PEZI|nr:hypothetical protein CSOJ01_00555 [Colletotrichum sojae]